MLRFVFVLTAWCVGWTVYMIAMMLTVYDGLLSLLFQPVMAAWWSAVFTALALFFGLVFGIPLVGRTWRSSYVWPVALAAISVFVMCAGPFLGWTETFPGENGTPVTTLQPGLAIVSYFVLLFALANWPLRARV